MQAISEITRRDIFDILRYGFQSEKSGAIWLTYYGRLTEIEFLNRLYNLQELPSTDGRFRNAEGDIWQHTVNNDDWETDWIFSDSRFQLLHGPDEVLLKFLCEIFHPAVREEVQEWEKFLEKINLLLQPDGYELFVTKHISGRGVNSWRTVGQVNPILESQTQQIMTFFDSEYVQQQFKLLNDLVDTSPYSAIGKAKEILETCCKTLLSDQHLEFSKDTDLPELMGLACDSIGLNPRNISDTHGAKAISSRILGNLRNIAQGLAELRNMYGDGHGKHKNFVSLPPRYAHLAAGATVTAVNFMLETYAERECASPNGSTSSS